MLLIDLGVLHVVGFVAIVIVLSAIADKHDAHYVFAEFSYTSGWSSDGVSWLVGLLSTVYPFLGYDAACHLAEEMVHPARNVPIALVGSVVVNGIMGFGYSIILLFSLGDLNSLLASPIGFPFMQLFFNVTESTAGATVMSLIPTLIAIAANAAGNTSTSRTAWAFARDNAIPFSQYFAHVNPTLKVPVRMVVCITILEALLGFIYLGNTTAFNAVLSMAILGMYASYLLPIVYMVLYGRKPGKLIFGPFQLGRVGGTIANVIAICWLVFAMMFSTFPSFEPVTAQNMNYSTVVMGGWLFSGAVYYFLFGRKRYEGPSQEPEK
jgi:choline transport protein